MDSFQFDLPKNKSSVIKVVGVGGGGNNAVNYMYDQGIEGVDFIVCNTDAQALNNSPISNKLQLGAAITEGLGAGANPEVGEQAALESKEEIKAMLESNTKLIFITAGMGGGTGTGAAPVIASIAKEMGILTIGIVTYPFEFEGTSRLKAAEEGVNKLRETVDSLIVINNNKLRDLFGNLGYKSGFSKADEVLAKAAKGIAEVITQNYTINIDLRDAKTVLSNSGTAIMGSYQAQGENRAKEAISGALDSPLLNDNKITGAKNVLLLIMSGSDEITIDEIHVINEYIQTEAGNNANIIMGIGEDESLENAVSVTIVATGFPLEHQEVFSTTSSKKVYHTLRDEQAISKTLFQNDHSEGNSNLSFEGKKEGNITRYELEDEDEMDTFSIGNNQEEAALEEDLDSELMDEEFEVRTLSEEEMQSGNSTDDIEEETQVEDLPRAETQQTTIFSLDDFEEEVTNESTLQKPEEKLEKIEESQEIKISATEKETSKEKPEDDPKISNELQQKIEERRQRLKQFNAKHKDLSKNVDEAERIPAYKRKGIDLDESQESKKSKFYLDTDEDDIQIRPNNFFEDNVD